MKSAGGTSPIVWRVFLSLIILLIGLCWVFPILRTSEIVLGWVGASWAVCSFWQQQDLEKTRFFFELFNNFNERYNLLNEDLDQITQRHGPLSTPERQKVVDYFNLCAEEYMFYRRGYIPGDVWTSWANGIRHYKRNPRFVTAWRDERGTDSHYGFDFEAVYT